MMDLFGVPVTVIGGQLVLGLVNGCFYAILSLGLAIIFGLLNVVNFAHGALYMLGGYASWMLLNYLGINYWWALLISPLVVGVLGVVIELSLVKRLKGIDPIYGLLLLFGVSLIIEGLMRELYGISGQTYPVPKELTGGWRLGFMVLPIYRGWVVFAALVVCLTTWFVIEKTRLGSYLRAATERPEIAQSMGINVPLLISLTFGCGAALAAFAGVLAAPITQVNSIMGNNLIIVVFAVVVIGGMGSILGSIATGITLGVIEGITKIIYPEASSVIVFLIMALVLTMRPAGLFGKEA